MALAGPLDNWTNQAKPAPTHLDLDCAVHRQRSLCGRYGEYSRLRELTASSEDGHKLAASAVSDGKTTDATFSFAGTWFTGNRFFALGGFMVLLSQTNGVDWTVFPTTQTVSLAVFLLLLRMVLLPDM